MFVKITNGVVEKAPYTIGDLRKAHPNVSFPQRVPDEVLETFGVHRVVEVPPPEVDTRAYTYSFTVALQGGKYTQVWLQDQRPLDVASDAQRRERDRRLAATDWRFRSDQSPSQAWIDYCQALRDLPAQEGFPYTVNWPVEP